MANKKPQLCAYGCGKPFTPLHQRGAQTPKGHNACYNESRRAATAAKVADFRAANVSCRDDLRDLTEPKDGYAVSVRAQKSTYAKGWEPRVEVDGDSGVIITDATGNRDLERDAILKGSDLDPKEWEIVGDLGFNKWQTPVPIDNEAACTCSPKLIEKHYENRWNYQYKVKLRRYYPKKRAELEAIIEEIRTHVPVPFAPPRGDDALVIAIADVQMGKGDQGGSPVAIANFLRSMDAFTERVPALRAQGKAYGTLYILGMGDLIENCDNFYAQQTYTVDNNLRDQVKIMRRLIIKAMEAWTPMFERVVVPVVGGNHGENRKDGKSFTDFGDNHDLAIFEQVQEILDANRAAYGHVSFLIPKDDPVLTLDMGGEIVATTHGHIFRGQRGKGPKVRQATPVAQNAINWWAAQAHGQQAAGDARVLFIAHNHHFLAIETGAKTLIACPALESGSDWFRYQSGESSHDGMLTVRVGKNVAARGWADLEVV